MWKKGLFVLGGIVLAPFVKPILRPLAREAVRGGLAVGAMLHRLAEEARENVEDLAAEARDGGGVRGRRKKAE